MSAKCMAVLRINKLHAAIALVVGTCCTNVALAQNFPSRAVRMLIPFTVGSAADVIARAMEPALRERLGQPLVIDNRAGAGGNIAAELTAKSPPDGYTVFMGTIGTQAINYSLYSKLNYHPLNSFSMIARVGDSPNVLVLNAETSVLAQRNQGAELRARALDAQVSLMRALGGGWRDDKPAPAALLPVPGALAAAR